MSKLETQTLNPKPQIPTSRHYTRLGVGDGWLGCRVWELAFVVWGLGFGFSSFRVQVQGYGFLGLGGFGEGLREG